MKERLFLWLWALAWHLALPLVLIYIYRRAKAEPLYSQAIKERFGFGASIPAGAIWIHAVSLGEVRAASPLITALVKQGERVIITNMTAAGRSESHKIFADDIAAGQIIVRWCPMELPWAIRNFIRRCQPRFGMIMEIELWPQLIAQTSKAFPLIMAQAQYPDKSFARDQKGLAKMRALSVQRFDRILAKSERHAERFQHFEAKDVRVVGELRFEQSIPTAHVQAAKNMLAQIDPNRPRLCLASTAPDEDPLLIPVLQSLKKMDSKPFFIYVPRHPKDFAATKARLEKTGLNMLQRSVDLDEQLALKMHIPPDCDGLFGDSLGEINFYYALAQRVFVGDSFNDEGSHNIIEPLRLMNPVAVGPSIWGIEYPGVEALAAGVLTQVQTPDDLAAHWQEPIDDCQIQNIDDFLKAHGDATQRIINHLQDYRLLK